MPRPQEEIVELSSDSDTQSESSPKKLGQEVARIREVWWLNEI